MSGSRWNLCVRETTVGIDCLVDLVLEARRREVFMDSLLRCELGDRSTLWRWGFLSSVPLFLVSVGYGL